MVRGRHLKGLTVLLFGFGALACGDAAPTPAEPGVVAEQPVGGGSAAVQGASQEDPVVVQVGREHVGSPFPPGSGHDASSHAKDAIRPRTTVIRAGTTVRFVVMPAHTAAVYEPGVTPDDIDLSNLTFPGPPGFPPVIDDPVGRLDRTDLNLNFATGDPIELEVTFEEPGRYLVICEVLPHFVQAKMYAWIDVK